jgi:hypothetical protein
MPQPLTILICHFGDQWLRGSERVLPDLLNCMIGYERLRLLTRLKFLIGLHDQHQRRHPHL